MEFISKENTREILEISNDCSFIILKGILEKVTGVSFFNEKSAKFETDNYKIKYSNNVLYLYDNSFKLLEEFIKAIPVDNSYTQEESSQILKFMVKKDSYIELITTKDKKRLNDKDVISEYKFGMYYTVYKDTSENELYFSRNTNRMPHKYNGIPIGLIST